ncbi:hypothetical protein AJ81_05650 [Pseudothermotoga hypogea DSM 11164 = NBRC 106472]|uniref:Uncharacterized protein n=1 Tax=Pseudothermotoga hypogea DSM 11164 = NBRC 106472 TaxID=1123384 RepID=A0A0X1KU17_9THEM|nr:hypothetical protein AJ81_05650 [Pseudothermotoga hypogea DSM 11164 = NBRC 106472]
MIALVLVLSSLLLILLVVAFRVFRDTQDEIKRRSVWLIILCVVLLVLSTLFWILGG